MKSTKPIPNDSVTVIRAEKINPVLLVNRMPEKHLVSWSHFLGGLNCWWRNRSEEGHYLRALPGQSVPQDRVSHPMKTTPQLVSPLSNEYQFRDHDFNPITAISCSDPFPSSLTRILHFWKLNFVVQASGIIFLVNGCLLILEKSRFSDSLLFSSHY
ncbi:hypothetical protein CDAR_576381 [Caerostris darwini]|uniref:Uncharacterized protein n=1 Tax=Caerostris darwini TaxID=1538125 RepID=A0AAV4UIZ6_9ARAC|nr:hypothetical protein CDAR_576381 [Caerostris darwini]